MTDRGKAESIAYAVLRIVAGAMFTVHGVQKIFGVLATHPSPPVFSQMWIGGVIELVGGVLIAIGLFTRATAFLCSGTMAVAYIQFHWKLQLDSNLLPGVNGGELAVLYCFLFLLFVARGAGIWSVDDALDNARGKVRKRSSRPGAGAG
jgi:putative oxidoreductase